MRRILIQVVVAIILFTVVSVILERSYSQEVWFAKGKVALAFGAVYGVFLVVKEKFIKK